MQTCKLARTDKPSRKVREQAYDTAVNLLSLAALATTDSLKQRRTAYQEMFSEWNDRLAAFHIGGFDSWLAIGVAVGAASAIASERITLK